MRKIDAYCHFVFPGFVHALEAASGQPHEFSRLFANTPALVDPEARLALMDRLGVERHVLVPLPEIGMSPGILEHPGRAVEVARICNDAMAAMVQRWPDRFVGVAMLPQSNGDTLAGELDRAVNELGLAGGVIGLAPNLKAPDHPAFEALWEKAVALRAPIWMHPARSQAIPDYTSEGTPSKYQFFQTYAWLLDTTLAMHRIVFSGVFERHPTLKLVAHHHGALVPMFQGRVDVGMRFFEANAGVRFDTPITGDHAAHYGKFWIDTATHCVNPRVLQLAYDFFGPDRVCFGTDTPMDASNGLEMGANADRSVAELAIDEGARRAVYAGNAERLLSRDA